MAMTLNSSEQERVNNVYNEREKALADNSSLYEGLINNATTLRDQTNEYLAQQQQLQDKTADANLEYQKTVINQQKEEAGKNKKVEENKAINDYTSYINPYGLQNEKLYGAGLGNSGVSETSKLGAYTAYQNRVSQAGANYQTAITQYNLKMDEAIKDNDAQKAQNALNKLKLELQNNQDYLSNVSSLSEAREKNANTIKNTYLDQYNTVYSQILKERQMEEDARQFNEQMALQNAKIASSGSGSSGSSGSSSKTGTVSGSTSSSALTNAGQYGSTTELYQWQSPQLVGYDGADKDMNWYKNNFEKHSYQEKDLIWVLNNAVENKQLSKRGANYIYSSYSPNARTTSSKSNNTNQIKSGIFGNGLIQATVNKLLGR